MGYGNSLGTALTRLLVAILKVREVKECEELMKIFCETAPEMAESDRKRGHATDWHAEGKYQAPMEVSATMDWAEQMNICGWQIYTNTIRKNPDAEHPDCVAMMGGLKKIGVEVTELVDEEAIRAHPKVPRYQGPGHFRKHFPDSPIVKWSPAKLERYLWEIVQKKDMAARSPSVSEQFLLIVTGEPWFIHTGSTVLPEYLEIVKLARSRNLDGVYIMGSPMTDGDSEDAHHPVFEIPLAGSSGRFAP